jgi:2-polyprenyl-3-methyl-5-hydroxy-6-metoxy-1,4-benzoquinol methylase
MSVYTLKDSRYSSHMRLLEILDPAKMGRRLLDVGCGNGFVSRMLRDRGFSVRGVEHPKGFDAALTTDLEILARNLEEGLGEVGGLYDIVLLADVLEHLRDPAALLEELSGVLSPDGAIVASLPNSGNIWFRLNILLGRFPEDEKGLFDRTHLHFYMLDNWERLFQRAGYGMEVLEVTPIPVSLVAPALHWAERLCYYFAVVWRTLFAYQFLVRAKRK